MITLQDLMSKDVITVTPELSLRRTAELLSTENVSGAPVVSGEKIVGVVSVTDLLEFEVATPGVPTERVDQIEWGEIGEPVVEKEGEEPPASYFSWLWADVGADILDRITATQGPEWDALDEHSVEEIMTHSLCALPPEADIREAADYMTRIGIHRILVIEDDVLVGIVTATDIVRAVAEEKI